VVFSGSSTNKTDRHDVTEILLKVALNTSKQTHKYIKVCIPVTITHVKESRKIERKKVVFFVDTMIMLAIFISLYNDESFRSSNKLVNFFKN